MQFPEALEAFLVSRRAKLLAVRTLEWYEDMLLVYGEFLKTRNLESVEVAPGIIQIYLAQDAARLAPATIHARWRSLSSLYNWLFDMELIAKNPMKKVGEPKVPKRQPKTAKLEEYLTLLESIPSTNWIGCRDRLAVQTLFLTGVRVSGLLGLQREDYDLNQQVLRVRNKGGDDMLIPLLPPVIDAFVQFIFVRPAWTNDRLFLSDDSHGNVRGELTVSGFQQRLIYLCRKAGIRHLNPHSFRHGLATYLLNSKGADMSLIQRILGHKKMSTTSEIYAGWNIDGVSRQYVNLMGDTGSQKKRK